MSNGQKEYYLPHLILDGMFCPLYSAMPLLVDALTRPTDKHIEIYAGYKNHPLACWDVYRKIWLGDFTRMAIPPVYDGILAIDIIEHLDKAQGEKQILRLTALARKVFILSIPLGEYPQGAYVLSLVLVNAPINRI